MEDLGGQTVTVVARVQDPDGDWTDGPRTVVTGCSVQPSTSSEDTEARDQQTQRFQVFGPPALAAARGSAVLEVDAAIVGRPGERARLHLLGAAQTWPDETGQPHHVEATAAIVTG